MHQFLKFIFGIKLYIFRTIPPSIIRSFSLYTQQWYVIQVCWQLASRIRTECFGEFLCPSSGVFHCTHSNGMSYKFADSLRAGSGRNVLILLALLCVQWKTPDDGRRNCPKHVEFYSKNKFEKLVHLVGFIIRILSRCTVTWTSNSCQMVTWVYLQWHKVNEYKCHYHVERVFQSLYGLTAWYFANGNFFTLYLSLPWISSRSFHAVTKWRPRSGSWPFPANPHGGVIYLIMKYTYKPVK